LKGIIGFFICKVRTAIILRGFIFYAANRPTDLGTP